MFETTNQTIVNGVLSRFINQHSHHWGAHPPRNIRSRHAAVESSVNVATSVVMAVTMAGVGSVGRWRSIYGIHRKVCHKSVSESV